MLNASKLTAKAALIIRDSEVVADLHSRADVMDSKIGVELEPFIERVPPADPCGGSWSYDGIENGRVHLVHDCTSHGWRSGLASTQIKLMDLLQLAATG